MRAARSADGALASSRSGWWVVVGGSVLLTLQNGLINAAFGAYLVAITADTGWAPGAIAVGYAIIQLGNGFIAPLAGWACDRFGTRAVARLGTVTTAVGFGFAAAAVSAPQFVGAVVVIALGISAAGIMPLTVAVVQAVPERRTLALGLLPTGIAVGGLLVPLVVLALDGLGWRTTFWLLAAVIVVIGLAAGAVLPGVGEPAGQPAEPKPAAAPPEPSDDHDLGSAVRTAAFWLLVLGHGTALVAIGAVNLHLVPLLTHDRGLSLTTAGIAVAVVSIMQLVGQVLTGLVADLLDKRMLAAVCMLVQTVVLVVLAVAPDLTTLMVASVVHGLAWGLRGPVMTAMRTDYFGISSFGTIMGWSTGLVSMGLVLGPLLVSGLEAGPGYRVAFLVVAAITGVGSLAFVALRRPRPHAVAAGPAGGRGGAVTPG